MTETITGGPGPRHVFAPHPDPVEGMLHRIYIIFEESDGRLWASGNRGFARKPVSVTSSDSLTQTSFRNSRCGSPGFSGTTGFSATPHGPDRPSRGSGWPCHAPVGASRVASISLLHACPRHYPGGTGRCSRHSLPDRWQPSLYNRRVGFRVTRFEACSAFTRVAAHMLAEPPMVAFTVEVLQTILLPPSSAPTASG